MRLQCSQAKSVEAGGALAVAFLLALLASTVATILFSPRFKA